MTDTSMSWEEGDLLPCACGWQPRAVFHATNGAPGIAIGFECCGASSGAFRAGDGGAPMAIAAWNAEQKARKP